MPNEALEGADGDPSPSKKAKLVRDEEGDSAEKKEKKNIAIEEARSAIEGLAIGTHRGGNRVVLVYPLEALRADAANTLLDFESSIQKELEAELLIGRDLNLERARLLALNGDIEGATRELISQAGTLEELQGMNVLQQQALAGAVGLSADQLSDMLLNQKSLNAVAQEGLDRDAQKVLENEKALSLQEQMNLSLQKMGDILKLMLPLLIGVTTALALVALPFVTGAGTIAAIAGGAALAAGAYQYVNDGMAPSSKGPFTITDRYGATAITSRGDNVVVSPNVNQGSDSSEMRRTNQLLERLVNQPSVFKIGTDEFFTSTSKYSYQVQ
jgi:hypothetical protein